MSTYPYDPLYDPGYGYYLQPTRLSDVSSILAQGEQPLDKDRSIIAQSAGKDAAELVKAVGAQSADDAFAIYDDLKTRIFNSTLALAGAESVVERFEGKSEPARTESRSSGGSSGGLGDIVFKSGKYAGKTIADVADSDLDYLEWTARESKNTFLKDKVGEYLRNAA